MREFISLYLVGYAQAELLNAGLVARFGDISVIENRIIGKFETETIIGVVRIGVSRRPSHVTPLSLTP